MFGVRDTVEYKRLTEQLGMLQAKIARLERVEAAAAKLVKAIESGKWKSAQKRLESALEGSPVSLYVRPRKRKNPLK